MSMLPLQFRGHPLWRHAASISAATSSTPSFCRTLVNSVGPESRIKDASRAITDKSAPTCGAKSICEVAHNQRVLMQEIQPLALLITSRSLCEMPGPPLRGTLWCCSACW